MNILYIDHYIGSNEYGMEFRPYYFARNWVKWGHNVTIVGASFSHLRIKNPIVEKDLQEELIDGISYIWLKTNSYKGNGIGRAISIAEFLCKLNFYGKKLSNRLNPDVVISSSTYPMDTYPAQRICRHSGAKLIHEVHDMWPICPMELYGLSKHNPLIMFIQAAENSFCKKSDAIVSIQPYAEEYYLEHGMPKGHFFHVPNGVVASEWKQDAQLPHECEKTIDELHEKYGKIVCFFGSHTKSYALDYLLEAAAICHAEPISFLLVGDGNIKNNLVRKAKQLKLENVRFMDSIPKKCIPVLLDKVDGIYIGALHNNIFKYGSCMNKTYDSMMSGKPIIFANPAPNNYILDYSCGFNVEPENSIDLSRALKAFARSSNQELDEMGSRGINAVLENFEYSKLSIDFINIIESIL